MQTMFDEEEWARGQVSSLSAPRNQKKAITEATGTVPQLSKHVIATEERGNRKGGDNHRKATQNGGSLPVIE
jgi:hypothetical protein